MNVCVDPKIDCCGCGTCISVCPTVALSMRIKEDGELVPQINEENCIYCGNCTSCCPQDHFIYKNYEGFVSDKVYMGSEMGCYNVQSKDKKLLRNSASGGFITDLVSQLLEKKIYDCAFLVDNLSYGGCVKTTKVWNSKSVKKAAKSKYVQVSHEEDIKYILKNRDKKVIMVGTPCFVHGFIKVIEKYKLKRQNYLIIGLFCDSTMTQHVWQYFSMDVFGKGKIEYMFFKDKRNGGWPGNITLLKDGKKYKFSNFERMNVKKYFMPESCLYCLDKLNMFADFSVGDNYYGGKLHDKKGSSSIIIRTLIAKSIWNKERDIFYYNKIKFDNLAKSQKINDREINLSFSYIKHNELIDDSFVPPVISEEHYEEYKQKIEFIRIGREGQYEKIYQDGAKQRKRINLKVYKIASFFVNFYRMKKKQRNGYE